MSGANTARIRYLWAWCGLSSALLGGLRHHYYISPTPIRAQAAPFVMGGRDYIGISRTGSEKHSSRRPRAVPGDSHSGLAIASTRELALQIFSETKPFSKDILFLSNASVLMVVAELRIKLRN